MFVIERRLAQLFRTALRRCFDGPAAQADQISVLLRLTKSGLLMHARHEEFAIMYSQPNPIGKCVLAFSASALEALEGRTSDPIELTPAPSGEAVARWSDHGVPREIQLTTLDPQGVLPPPDLPKEFAPMPANFLPALHEASLSTAKEPTKYVLHRLLLKGKSGEIVGSDSKQLLIQGGFPFPFQDNLIIPRAGVFGLPPFQTLGEVGIGRTESWVAIRAGRWIFAFAIDAKGRFPDTSGLVPAPAKATTRFHLDPQDAEFFLKVLSRRLKGPGAKEFCLTLDLTEPPCFRFKIADERLTELSLPRSRLTGKSVRLNLDLKQFLRAVELRFQEFEIRDPEKPLVARDERRVFLAMPLNQC